MLTREQRRCATARALPLKERQRPVSPGGGVRRRGAKDNPPGETGLWGAAGSAPLDSTSPVGQQTQWLRKSATPGGPVGWCDGRRCGERLQAQRAAESAPTSHGADPVAASRGGAHAGTQCEAPLVGQQLASAGREPTTRECQPLINVKGQIQLQPKLAGRIAIQPCPGRRGREEVTIASLASWPIFARARVSISRRLRTAPIPRSDTRPLRKRAGAIPLLRCFRLQAASCWPRC